MFRCCKRRRETLKTFVIWMSCDLRVKRGKGKQEQDNFVVGKCYPEVSVKAIHLNWNKSVFFHFHFFTSFQACLFKFGAR